MDFLIILIIIAAFFSGSKKKKSKKPDGRAKNVSQAGQGAPRQRKQSAPRQTKPDRGAKNISQAGQSAPYQKKQSVPYQRKQSTPYQTRQSAPRQANRKEAEYEKKIVRTQAEDAAKSEDALLMQKVYDLMITGYSGNLQFERDFLAEGVDMLNRMQQ